MTDVAPNRSHPLDTREINGIKFAAYDLREYFHITYKASLGYIAEPLDNALKVEAASATTLDDAFKFASAIYDATLMITLGLKE